MSSCSHVLMTAYQAYVCIKLLFVLGSSSKHRASVTVWPTYRYLIKRGLFLWEKIVVNKTMFLYKLTIVANVPNYPMLDMLVMLCIMRKGWLIVW